MLDIIRNELTWREALAFLVFAAGVVALLYAPLLAVAR